MNALKNIPIGLAALLENLDLFIVLIIDIWYKRSSSNVSSDVAKLYQVETRRINKSFIK